MATVVSVSKSRPMWRRILNHNIVNLGLIAAGATAIYRVMDNVTVHNIAIAQDALTAAFAYLIIGAWTGVLSGFVFAILFGRHLDPEYKGIIIANPKMHEKARISGAIGALSTLFVLLGNQIGDPSMLIALTNMIVVFTVLYDVRAKHLMLKSILLPASLALVGGGMAAYGGSLYVTALGLLYVVVLSNGLETINKVVTQKGVRASDGINLFLWRFFWLAAIGTGLGLAYTVLWGHTGMLITTLQHMLAYLWWLILTMFFVFLGIGIELILQKKHAISEIIVVMSIQMILGYPITIIGNKINPELFGAVSTDTAIWLIRIVGAMFMLAGIAILRKNAPKANG